VGPCSAQEGYKGKVLQGHPPLVQENHEELFAVVLDCFGGWSAENHALFRLGLSVGQKDGKEADGLPAGKSAIQAKEPER